MSKGALAIIVSIACVLASTAAGCGGSGTDTLTRSEFKKQANEICLQEEKERSLAVAQLQQGSNSLKDAEDLVIKLMPAYERAAEKIDELGAPQGDEGKVEAIVDAMRQAAEKATADPGTAVAGNLQFREADELAEKYGLKNCKI